VSDEQILIIGRHVIKKTAVIMLGNTVMDNKAQKNEIE